VDPLITGPDFTGPEKVVVPICTPWLYRPFAMPSLYRLPSQSA